jgi:uncharacterized protein with PIN domain
VDGDPVTLLVPPALQLFLRPTRRHQEQRLPSDGTSTVGHLLASIGVPRTEVGSLRLGDSSVDLAYRPRPGDRIVVVPLAWPQAAPTDPPRFLLDVHLGTLARRLRLLGVDTAYSPDAEDPDLVEASLAERRVLLTRDRGLLHRRALRWAAHVRSDRPDEQAREVLTRFDVPVRPWTRCLACNGLLEEVAKADVADRLEPGTRRTQDRFVQCTSCGKVYWRGAHQERLRTLVDRLSAEG